MNIIWTKEELDKINEFLKKYNLEFSDEINYNVVVSNKYQDTPNFLPTYLYHCEELNRLFMYQDKKEIYNILKRTIPIRYIVKNNKNNPLCNGLLTALANINPSDATEIFVIFKELLSQYIRISYNTAEYIADRLKDSKLIREKIEEIRSSTEETKEERYIKNYFNKLLSYTNGVFDNELFSSLIYKCYDNIKHDLINNLYRRCAVHSKRENYIKGTPYESYFNDVLIKLRKIGKIDRYYTNITRG